MRTVEVNEPLVLNPLAFHEVVSGQRRDFRATALRLLLHSFEPVYAMAVATRNRLYQARVLKTHRAAVPVISIGNITTGGTGKTPLVAWVADWLRQQSLRVVIVSRGYGARGYGAQAGAANDEAAQLQLQLPDVPHLQNPDRVAAAREAIERHACDVILLDDAFQHRRLHRDLDIVLLDALQPFGFEHLLPRGLLREPITGLGRAHVIGLSRAQLIDQSARAAIWSRVGQVAPRAVQVEIDFRPQGLRSATGQLESLDVLAGQELLAFCGIGNPQGFEKTLECCGFSVAGLRAFPDHHGYTASDFASIAAWADRFPRAAALVCTEKDLVKIDRSHIGRWPLWSLCISAEFSRGQEAFLQRLAAILPAQPA